MAPLVSVVVPVADDAAHLREAIRSVRDQADEAPADGVEVVVVHSGPESAFPADLRGREWLVYDHQPPEGPAAARNRALDLARGDVVGFCDADDLWHPEKLARQLPALAGDPDVVYADEYLLRDGAVHRIDALPVRDPERHHVDYFRNGGGVGSRSVLADAAVFEAERFDERFGPREDPHLWTRVFARFRPAHVPEALSYKRADSAGVSADVDRAYRMEQREVADLAERYPELAAHRAERERRMRLRYAKRLLSEDGRAADARRVLLELVCEGHLGRREAVLLALSLLPAGNREATRRLQSIRWQLRAARR